MASHAAVDALRAFRLAVEKTAPGDPRLPEYLYWFSVSLIRLGRLELAARSLASARAFERRGHASRLFGRIVNGYGMVRTDCAEHDDFRAFASIQIRNYLASKKRRSFGSIEERDAVVRVLVDGWARVSAEGALEGKSCAERLEHFRNWRMSFPDRVVGCGCPVIQADFRTGRRVNTDDRCSCGSGLPFRMCCGRTKTPAEYLNG